MPPTAIRNERWENRQDGTLLRRRTPPNPVEDSGPSFFSRLCPGHVLKQWLLPAGFDDGVTKGFRKAV